MGQNCKLAKKIAVFCADMTICVTAWLEFLTNELQMPSVCASYPISFEILHSLFADVFENISNSVKQERLQPSKDTLQVSIESSLTVLWMLFTAPYRSNKGHQNEPI